MKLNSRILSYDHVARSKLSTFVTARVTRKAFSNKSDFHNGTEKFDEVHAYKQSRPGKFAKLENLQNLMKPVQK